MAQWLLWSAVLIVACGNPVWGQASQSAGDAAKPKASSQALPVEWEGVWKGMTVMDSPQGKMQEVPMELHVSAVPGGNVRNWRILYGEGTGQSARPYEISPVEGEPGRFVIDEKNGLLIDNQLIGKTLYSLFLVTTNIVSTRFELRGDQIHVEMSMFDARTPRQSKLTGGNIEVSAYRFRSVQHGTLKREQAAVKK